MSDSIDNELRDFYGEQEIPEDTLAAMLQMAEADDAPPSRRPRRRLAAWAGMGALLSAAAASVLVLQVVLIQGGDSVGTPVATSGPVHAEPMVSKLDPNREGKKYRLSGEEKSQLDALGYLDPADSLEVDEDGDGRYVDAPVERFARLDVERNGLDEQQGRAEADPSASETTERERDYGLNPVVPTREDPLSTFAIDVDTASYTRTRASLLDGHLPSRASVRVEEFVNYLPYEYARPERGEPFTVDAEAVASPFSDGTLVRIGVQGRHVHGERKPVHLTFLVDTSGSMAQSDKLELVKDSLLQLVDELEDGDSMALVTYAGQTSVRLPATSISDAATVKKAIRSLSSSGSTAMGAGIDLAYAQSESALVEGAVNRVILCSDGDANVGITDPDVLAKRLRGYAQKGITLTTLGFGRGTYNDTVMEQLANQGDGNYYFIDDEIEARRVLVDRLTGTLQVIAKDVKIQVEWDPTVVEEWRLIGYENRHLADRDFREDKVDAGEIGAGHQVTALYEVTRTGAAGALGTVRVRSKAPGPEAPAAERSYSLPSGTHAGSRDTQRATVMAGFAEKLRGHDVIGWERLLMLAREAARAEYEEDAELVALIERASSLSSED